MFHRYEIVNGPSSLELANALLESIRRHSVLFQLKEWPVAVKDTHIAGFPPRTPFLLVNEIKRVSEKGNEALFIVGLSQPQPVIQRQIPFKAYYSTETRVGWIEFEE